MRLWPVLLAPAFLFVSGCAVSSPTSNILSAPVGPASITVHTGNIKGTISPLLFGVNVEWTENGNRIADPVSHSLRQPVLGQLSPLRIPVFRFPGGILSDYYHWTDGVGPIDKRPIRTNPMDGAKYSNTFGTEELIELCKQLHAQPLITANVGTGTAAEAAAWQQQFAQKGMPVRFWEIGNEIYLAEPKRDSSIPGNDERIYKTAAQYATAFHAFSSALHKAGADTLVGAIAGTYNTSKENRGWLDTILQQNAAEMDFLSLHNSFAPIITTKYDFSDEHNRNDAYLATYAHAARAGEDIAQVRAALKRSKSAAADRIAITEHFPLFGASNSHDQLLAILDQSRTMAAALYTASLFHVYMRENVWMADYNLALSQWFGALLLDGDHGLVRAPVWHVWDLYRNHFGTELVDVSLQSSTYSTGALGVVEARNNVLLLDAVASKDAGGNYFLAVVNRHPKTPISSTIKLDDAALHPSGLWTLEAKAPNAVNGPSLSPTTQSGDPDSIRIKELSPAPLASGTYTFPPTSVTVVEWSPVREMTNRRMAAREN